jgi:phage gpG-like protein
MLLKELSLMEFVKMTAVGGLLASSIERCFPDALEEGAQVIEDEAKRVIGTYDYDWPQLAPSTQEERTKQGFPANEPLLRTGELRDSIEHTIVSDHEAQIGSNLDIAVYQELGTRTIPPRSFLAQAAAHKEEDVGEKVGRHMIKAILPK